MAAASPPPLTKSITMSKCAMCAPRICCRTIACSCLAVRWPRCRNRGSTIADICGARRTCHRSLQNLPQTFVLQTGGRLDSAEAPRPFSPKRPPSQLNSCPVHGFVVACPGNVRCCIGFQVSFLSSYSGRVRPSCPCSIRFSRFVLCLVVKFSGSSTRETPS